VLGRPRRIHYRWDGGGFEYDNSELFARYGPNPDDVHASHSICLQALGERGWIGIEIFMYIWAYTWTRCRRISRLADDSDDGRAQSSPARMFQASMVGFAVGGAFVNNGNWDMAYYLMISALATARIGERQAADRKALAVCERAAARPATFERPASRAG
jgi:hypothetical protein